MLFNIAFFLSLISLVWLSILTVFFFAMSAHYNTLVKDTNKRSLQAILEGILKDIDVTKKDIATLSKQYDTIEKEGKLHIQKIGLLRFNPFKDTGGDQSFILALVDGNNTGVVISGLYSRSGTRWYAKKVKNSKGVEHTLSDDEQKALSQAVKLG